jgi:preprotein translocase subunit SecG
MVRSDRTCTSWKSMQTLILVIHVMVGVSLVVVIMLQRSEGGALGIGGSAGGGGGGLMSGRGAASLLTRATAILGATFMSTSIILAIMSGSGDSGSVLDAAPLPGIEAPLVPGPEVPAGPAVPVGD